jgi:hypothetical protein
LASVNVRVVHGRGGILRMQRRSLMSLLFQREKLTKMTANLRGLRVPGRCFRIEGETMLPYAASRRALPGDPHVY